MQLFDLATNQPAKLIDFGHISVDLRKKLIGMGMKKHCVFTVLRKAPLHGPWHIKVNHTDFTVRMNEIGSLNVEPINTSMKDASHD